MSLTHISCGLCRGIICYSIWIQSVADMQVTSKLLMVFASARRFQEQFVYSKPSNIQIQKAGAEVACSFTNPLPASDLKRWVECASIIQGPDHWAIERH